MPIKIISDPEVLAVFEAYPKSIKPLLQLLRKMILETANELPDIKQLHETLKWGQPSYLSKIGSTVRIGRWKEEERLNASDQKVAIYFICKTKLVDTFREIYSDRFRFEGNRAILVDTSSISSVEALKHCIGLALSYHQVKHLPLLGC